MSKLDPRSMRTVRAVRCQGGVQLAPETPVACEEPLEIRVAGDAVALTMRTPGDDRYLALGYLLAEGVIDSLDDVGSIYHCGRTDDARYGNVIEVTPGPGARLCTSALERTRRVGLTSSACGVCGRDGIDDLLARIAPVQDSQAIAPALIARLPELLRAGQLNFAHTGGLHGACAVTAGGRVLACAEDVGRHNAVDKVVGKLLMQGQLPRLSSGSERACLLGVSGRASFEIVQKAAAAGFGAVASVSAPSSLAIDTAEAVGITLAGFVREGRFTLYTHPSRVLAP